MPPREPRPPFVRARIRPNPAAAALGMGIHPDKWTAESIIAAMTTRYTQLVKLAETAKEQEDSRRQRLSLAGAYELALIIASYHQDRGDSELFARWDRRAKQASSTAYRTQNPIARTMGADPPPDLGMEEEDQ